jgi:hypothetical protein
MDVRGVFYDFVKAHRSVTLCAEEQHTSVFIEELRKTGECMPVRRKEPNRTYRLKETRGRVDA